MSGLGRRRFWFGRTSLYAKLFEVICFLPLVLWCALARLYWGRRSKPVQIGLGPEPLINNVAHAQALRQAGYSAETFVSGHYFITDEFDVNFGQRRCDLLPDVWRPLAMFARAVWRYRCMFIYFNGGPLLNTNLLAPLEPWLLKLAKVKLVVMPYGADIQDPIHSANLYFRHTVCQDYPLQRLAYPRIRRSRHRWSQHADWVMSGCEWVDYMHHWQSLQLAHFAIDTERWRPGTLARNLDSGVVERPLRILHAPNHRAIKGTSVLQQAVDDLQREGHALELVLLQGVPNTRIRQVMASVDLVADQFVIGWYAMFAIEAMAMAKPVMAYIRRDLLDLYHKAGLLTPGELPILNTDLLAIKTQLRWALTHREALATLGEQGRAFVLKHHSLAKIGGDFAHILQILGLAPQNPQLGTMPTMALAPL
jgi:hypothetical protein